MNLKEIKEIIALMNENGLAEIEVEREGSKIKIKKTNSSDSPARPTEYQIERQNNAAPAASASSGAPVAQASNGKATKEIVSPMVGTFYRASSPEAPPFVEVGQIVEVGQVVCIIEAMKLMNEIKSEVRGKVVDVAIENAEPRSEEHTSELQSQR